MNEADTIPNLVAIQSCKEDRQQTQHTEKIIINHDAWWYLINETFSIIENVGRTSLDITNKDSHLYWYMNSNDALRGEWGKWPA